MKDDLRNIQYVIDIGPQPSLPVAGSEQRFPVGRIYCVGRNYADHAREMGHDPDREPPFFFMKPANSIVQSGATIAYPGRHEGRAPRNRDGRGTRQGRQGHRGRARRSTTCGATAWAST